MCQRVGLSWPCVQRRELILVTTLYPATKPLRMCYGAQGLEQFRREHGRYPDLVVLHSNYWDIAQVVLFRWWEGWEPEYTQLMLDWLARAEKVATYLEVRAAVEAPLLLSPLHKQICSAMEGEGHTL